MLHAIVVGVNRYQRGIRPLRFARADAEAVADLLERRILPEERRIHRLLDEEATSAAVRAAVTRELIDAARPGDVVVLYFACHGSPELGPSGSNSIYLVMHDTPYRAIHAGIDMARDIMGWFRELAVASLVIVFLDACFAGAAGDEPGSRTFEGPLALEDKGHRGGDRISLEDLRLGKGRVIIAAASNDEPAREESSLGHGVFTYHLLRTLEQPAAEKGPTIGVLALYEEVAAAVAKATNDAQIPVANGQSCQAAFPRMGSASGAPDADERATTRTPPSRSDAP